MAKIKKIHAREVLDSRGNPTVEAEIYSDTGKMARAIVPSGASTGIHEALELRDKDPKRYLGKGVLKAVANVNDKIAPELKDFEIGKQAELDLKIALIDGTENKSKLGANAHLAVSMAYSRLSAMEEGKWLFESLGDGTTLPTPMMNVINGGAHATNNLDIQEFMIMPVGAQSFSEGLQVGTEIFHHLKKILKKDGFSVSVGDEGGFAPNFKDSFQALDYIVRATNEAGYELKKDIMFAFDIAISQFYKDGIYEWNVQGKKEKMDLDGLIAFYNKLIDKYPIFSIEDIVFEDDYEGWNYVNKAIGDKVQIVGDDFLVTNQNRLIKAIDENCANSILIKLNQIGSVTETLQTIKLAQEKGWQNVVSHRSGETEDTFIADLAVGTNAGQIKTGSLSRTDRVCKYNQLLRIEEYLASKK